MISTRLGTGLVALLLLVQLGCEGPEAEGILSTPLSGGPRIIFDIDHKPLPDVPYPNNIATRLDSSSATGRRINISLEADTLAERKLRAKINGLDGFGLFSPITVAFDGPLDLENIRDRHAASSHEFSNDVILLVNITPGSPDFGKPVPLDLGNGNYPLGLEWAWQYWDHDEHADSPNLLFETHDEDVNNNGLLDPYEDIDFDGVLDKPNTWSGKPVSPITRENLPELLKSPARPIDDLITFYEKETDTLIAWPVVPLRQGEDYAVVLTRHLVDENGATIESPFPYINHLEQTQDLAPLGGILAGADFGMSLDDVAFAWTFTTQTVTRELEAIRAGLYGHGPLADLAATYPPDLTATPLVDPGKDGVEPDKVYALYTDEIFKVLNVLAPLLGYPPAVVEALTDDTAHVDYWIIGSFTSPSFLADQDGIATPMYPADDNESFKIELAPDMSSGSAHHGPSKVTFLCAVPRATAEHQQPFPVATYGHGYSGAPFEVFGFAGRFAQYGYALCGLDAAGHGLALPADESTNWAEIVPGIAKALGVERFLAAFLGGRIRDLDNDGQATSFDNGGDFWSWDVFHTRDMVRQTVIDHLQFIRILRSLDTAEWDIDADTATSDGKLMGDFDGDGVVDLGGPWSPDAPEVGNRYYPVWGQSLGSYIASLLAATEATVNAATPIAGGAGLIHVGLRSTNPGVPEAVQMPLMGPFIVFHPLRDATDTVEIAFMINDQHREYCPHPMWAGITDLGEAAELIDQRADNYCPHIHDRPHYYRMLETNAIRPGDRVVVRNKTTGKAIQAFRHQDGSGFRVSMPCDAPSAVEKRPLLGLQDGDTQPVPISCAPGTWTVDEETDDEGFTRPVGPAHCDSPDLSRAALFGDELEVLVYDGWADLDTESPREVLDRFSLEVTYQGAIFPVDAPLVALGTGIGNARNTPAFRRLIGIAGMVVEKADPGVYARHSHHGERLDFAYDPAAAPQGNLIAYHAVGDPNVPVTVSLAHGRSLGALSYLPSEGQPIPDNDRLIETHVAEAVEGFWRYQSDVYSVTDWGESAARLVAGDASPIDKLIVDPRWPDEFYPFLGLDLGEQPGMAIHSDPDDLDRGTNEFGERTFGEPVRATLKTEWGTFGLRYPYTLPIGAHGVEPSNPTRQFNINNFVENQILRFMTTNGMELTDDLCLESNSCEWMPESVKLLPY